MLAIVSMKFVEHMNVYDILFINDQYVQQLRTSGSATQSEQE